MELEEVVALGRGVRDEDQAAAIDRTQACVEAAAPTVKAQRLQIPVTGSQGHVEVGGYGSRLAGEVGNEDAKLNLQVMGPNLLENGGNHDVAKDDLHGAAGQPAFESTTSNTVVQGSGGGTLAYA
jgi:hypothetical protein